LHKKAKKKFSKKELFGSCFSSYTCNMQSWYMGTKGTTTKKRDEEEETFEGRNVFDDDDDDDENAFEKRMIRLLRNLLCGR
tara:strand:+ start:3402 stop:3644 length:243 start_codon:yes stop_codon:yes gene_type:complete